MVDDYVYIINTTFTAEKLIQSEADWNIKYSYELTPLA